MKLPDEPSPVPDGISAILLISSARGSTPAQLQCLADDGMSNLFGRFNPLKLRVFEDEIVVENIVHRDIDIPVDRSRDEKPFMFAIIGWEIGPAPAQADPQRAAHDNHRSPRHGMPLAATYKRRPLADRAQSSQEAAG